MNSWFDRLARRAAQSSADASDASADDSGLSRRQVLARGAVLTGAAWTAPALLAARPAFAGASICPDAAGNPVFDICGDGTEVCCPVGEECVLTTRGRYECDTPPGGECTNRGNGQCNGGFSRCDQPSNTARFGICGGPGTLCNDLSNCQFGNCEPCTTPDPDGTCAGEQDRRCGGQGAMCANDAQCAPVDANNKTAFFCDFTQSSGNASQPGTCQPVA